MILQSKVIIDSSFLIEIKTVLTKLESEGTSLMKSVMNSIHYTYSRAIVLLIDIFSL